MTDEPSRLLLWVDLNAAIAWCGEQGMSGEIDVHVAGDGVGHFDQRIIGRGQFPLTAERLHYRPIDISHAVHALDARTKPMTALHQATGADREAYARVLGGMDVDPRLDAASAGTVEQWLDPQWVKPHRAAADVVQAMLAWLVARDRVGTRLGDGGR